MSQHTSIPAAIRAIRKRRKITQVTLGQLLHVAANTVCRWETGAIVPSKGNLVAIFRLSESEHEIGPLLQALTAQHISITDLPDAELSGLQETFSIGESAGVGQA
jgi:transcriptional regulator with XRE-family HTH domain